MVMEVVVLIYLDTQIIVVPVLLALFGGWPPWRTEFHSFFLKLFTRLQWQNLEVVMGKNLAQKPEDQKIGDDWRHHTGQNGDGE